jgi:hypothetical protein
VRAELFALSMEPFERSLWRLRRMRELGPNKISTGYRIVANVETDESGRAPIKVQHVGKCCTRSARGRTATSKRGNRRSAFRSGSEGTGNIWNFLLTLGKGRSRQPVLRL